jgi:transcriptional regulator with XRE-family HTH domain
MEHRERQIPPPWLGELIRTARLRAGLRGAEGARLAGLGRQYLVRLECGQRCPSVDAAERLAEAFKMTATERSVLLAAAVTKQDRVAA